MLLPWSPPHYLPPPRYSKPFRWRLSTTKTKDCFKTPITKTQERDSNQNPNFRTQQFSETQREEEREGKGRKERTLWVFILYPLWAKTVRDRSLWGFWETTVDIFWGRTARSPDMQWVEARLEELNRANWTDPWVGNFGEEERGGENLRITEAMERDAIRVCALSAIFFFSAIHSDCEGMGRKKISLFCLCPEKKG